MYHITKLDSGVLRTFEGMVAGRREEEPCRWAAAAVFEETTSEEPKLVDLSPRKQKSRGQELLRLLWEPITPTAAAPPLFEVVGTAPIDPQMLHEQVQDIVPAWSCEGQLPDLSLQDQVACGQELLRMLRDPLTSHQAAPCLASSPLKSPPNNVHIERSDSPNEILQVPVNAVMTDCRLWHRVPDQSVASLSTCWEPQRSYASQDCFSATCHPGNAAPDRYVIDLSSCLEHRRWQTNQDTSPEFSDASTDTPKEYDALEEISNYDMVEDDGRSYYRGLGKVCSPPLTPAPYFN